MSLKLLLICYECSPYVGSEWAVGWGRLLGAAKAGETHVITSEENFQHLCRARSEGLVPDNVFFYTPLPDAKLRRLEEQPGTYAYNYKAYNHWHKLAFRQMSELHELLGFDLVHQVNVCTFREPGYGYKLGVPFIWGPTGGSQNFPTSFLRMLPLKEAAKEAVRTLANQLTLRHRRVRSAARAAALIVGANSTNQRDFRKAFGREVMLQLETGLHEVETPNRQRFFDRVERAKVGLEPEPLRLLWSGELHTRKALPVLLHALASLRVEIPWELDVLGAGPMQADWKALSRFLGIAGKVRFLGRQPFQEAVEGMHKADLLCFTSLRDTSGNVVLEAMAAGVPVMCFDHQGAGDMVDNASGVKIPVTSPQQAFAQWAHAIEDLVLHPGKLLELSLGATRRAEQFLWSMNHARMNTIYRAIAGGFEPTLSEAEPIVTEFAVEAPVS